MSPRSPGDPVADAREELTAGDMIGAIIVAGTITFLFSFSFSFRPEFEKMFRDFGEALPAFTEIVLSPWCSPMLALSSAAVLALGLAPGTLRRRRRLLVGAFVIAALELALMVWALYLPIFVIAGQIE
jgi:hypothetical protein